MLLNSSALNAAPINGTAGKTVLLSGSFACSAQIQTASLGRRPNLQSFVASGAGVVASARITKIVSAAGNARGQTASMVLLGIPLAGASVAHCVAAGGIYVGYKVASSQSVAALTFASLSKTGVLAAVPRITALFKDATLSKKSSLQASIQAASTSSVPFASIAILCAGAGRTEVLADAEVGAVKTLAAQSSIASVATGKCFVDYTVEASTSALNQAAGSIKKICGLGGSVSLASGLFAQADVEKISTGEAEARALTSGLAEIAKTVYATASSVASTSGLASLNNPLQSLGSVASCDVGASADLKKSLLVEANATALTTSDVALVKGMEFSGLVLASVASNAAITKDLGGLTANAEIGVVGAATLVKNMGFVGTVTASSSSDAALTKSMAVHAEATANSVSSADITKILEMAVYAAITTDGSASITKNVFGSGSCFAGTHSLLDLRNVLAASVFASARANATAALHKRISGAGDEFSTLSAALKIIVGLEGMGAGFALTNSTIHITKSVNGYSVAQSVAVNARLRKLYFYAGSSASAEYEQFLSEAGAAYEDFWTSASAEVLGDVSFDAVIEEISSDAGAAYEDFLTSANAEVVGDLSFEAEIEEIVFEKLQGVA